MLEQQTSNRKIVTLNHLQDKVHYSFVQKKIAPSSKYTGQQAFSVSSPQDNLQNVSLIKNDVAMPLKNFNSIYSRRGTHLPEK